MDSPLQLAALRFETFAREVLEPAVHPRSAPLEVAAYQCGEPIPYDLALEQDYAPVEPGWRWGPAWSTAWFRLRGVVPGDWSRRRVALRFSSGTEATLWREGVPQHGLDANHDAAVLLERAHGGEELELYVEAACNGPLGVTTFWWDERELAARWREPKPGRLERCALATLDGRLWTLWRTYEFARQLLLALPPDAPRTAALLQALESATRRIDDRRPEEHADGALAALAAALRAGAPGTRTRCHAVGHAHIDTAWLWPIRETRRKCLRTFATALRLLERFDDFRFTCSQAQQYAWVEQDSPELFRQITERVREGRWEPVGAMWVEPDCNVPSGESLIRQLLHGTRYFRRRFGDELAQRVLFLPDTFGFPAALPQIMALAGVDTFITSKLAWNRTNRFPHSTFRWRGLDGTVVLAHCLPGEDYNATNTPGELRRGQARLVERGGAAASPDWLQPFGYGDGGGGPTDWMVHNARLAGDCEGLPEVRLSNVEQFRKRLHDQHRRRRGGDELPVWDGELYLELHRGTYTSHSWLKRANRRAERLLRAAEWLHATGPEGPAGDGDAAEIEGLWPNVLLNQFHDILPGSSIASVYADAREQLEGICATAAAAVGRGEQRWAPAFDTGGARRPALVINETSWPASGVVETDGDLTYARDVPAVGAAVIDRDAGAPVEPVRVEGLTMDNGVISATVDRAGRVVDLRRAGAAHGIGAGALNRLVLYEDLPRRWEAWDIDEEYLVKPSPVADAASCAVTARGPLRAVIETERPLGAAGRLVQRYVLDAGAPCLVVRTFVDWRESRRLLRALFPVDVRARRATCGVQFGHVERATHENTSWQRAQFEWCVHGWMDLSEPGRGLALLADGLYGQSCRESVMGLSLLRGPLFPDATADRGEHELVYALMPHEGDWRRAGVDRRAALLQAPLRAAPVAPGRAGRARRWSPLEVDAPDAGGIEVTAIKRAAAGDGLIVRLAETHGGRGRVRVRWAVPAASVEARDVLERPTGGIVLEHDAAAAETRFDIRPFQIVTLAIRA